MATLTTTTDRPAASAGALTRSLPAGRFVVFWALGWGVVGALVAEGIVLATELDLGPAIRISVLLAEVVGFTALVSARLVFPLFVRLPYALALPLQVLTLLSGTLFGSVAVAAIYPLLLLRQARLLGLVVLINALLAVAVGIALYTYDTMRRQIERTYDALRRKEALERELSIARDVQQQLLPTSPPKVAGLELAGINIPAIGVGGDYYDFLPLDDREVALVVADVSGKGVPAALLMAGLQAALRSLARPGASPAELSAKLNEILYRSSGDSRYATMFVGRFCTETRTLCYTNAGHHPPLVIGNHDTRPLREGGGMPIGLFEEARYGEAQCVLQPGDLVALFTDGVTEAESPSGEEYGSERLGRLLARHRTAPLETTVAAVVEDLRVWTAGGPAQDDVTVVLARTT